LSSLTYRWEWTNWASFRLHFDCCVCTVLYFSYYYV